ncbi:conjugal transfer mating pair stabilization protein TraG, partial [Escherichia coli]
GFHCRVSFHDDPAIILDDGQGAWGRIFQCVQPFRFLCYQPDCQCGR